MNGGAEAEEGNGVGSYDLQESPATARNMASALTVPGVFAVLFLCFVSTVQPVEAYDGGDAVALLLGMAITVVGFCACLGWYSRRRSGQF